MAFYEIENKPGKGYYCPMMDARRMEVYCNIYDDQFNELTPVQALIIDENSFDKFSDKPFYMFGDGAAKCREVLTGESFILIENSFPSATKLIKVALKKFQKAQFEDLAYFEPFYLKEFIAGKKKQSAE
jgi:tRNA threonylcarbamoyladenosine biosynthesis protein TsaB